MCFCVRACAHVHVCVVSVIIKHPAFPPCAVNGCYINPLSNYYYLVLDCDAIIHFLSITHWHLILYWKATIYDIRIQLNLEFIYINSGIKSGAHTQFIHILFKTSTGKSKNIPFISSFIVSLSLSFDLEIWSRLQRLVGMCKTQDRSPLCSFKYLA